MTPIKAQNISITPKRSFIAFEVTILPSLHSEATIDLASTPLGEFYLL